MKKLWVLPVLVAFLCVSLVACAPAKGSVDQGDMRVYPVSQDDGVSTIVMGDVMPFYDDGVMNIYHLQNSTGSLYMFYHPISRLTTTDFLHYTDEGIAINFEEDYYSPDASLGTGSFIKDASGKYHCFYTGHNGMTDAGLPYFEAVRHAVSTDGQKTWQKVDEFSLYGTENDFRDPYVYYDSVDNCYYMLVTTRANGRGVIKQYAADSLDAASSEWRDCGIFFDNDAGSYNMECPSYVEWNGFYYLAYSEQGAERVTHYRYKTERDGEWKKFERDSIDNNGFYAGRLEKTADGLYAFAWCAKLTGASSGDFDWGGNLVTHQIKQLESGELIPVMVSNVENELDEQVAYKLSNGKKVSKFNFDGTKFSAFGIETLSTNVTRLHFTITLNSLNGDFGLTFGLDQAYNNRLGAGVVAFNASSNRIECYNAVTSIIRYGSPLTSMGFTFETGKTYNVDVLIHGELLTVYFNETLAMTVRVPSMPEKCFAFYSHGTDVSIGEIAFYE